MEYSERLELQTFTQQTAGSLTYKAFPGLVSSCTNHGQYLFLLRAHPTALASQPLAFQTWSQVCAEPLSKRRPPHRLLANHELVGGGRW